MKTVPLEDMKDGDYNWRYAFHEAQFGFCGSGASILDDVVEVIAADAGENDDRDWIALVKLSDGRFVKMVAGCDYTGWDCQAGGSIEYYSTREELLSKLTLTQDEDQRLETGVYAS